MNMKADFIHDLISIGGSMQMPDGVPVKTDDGYACVGDGFEWSISLCEHPSGVTERRDVIRNTSDHPITIQTALSRFAFHGGEHEVYTQFSEWCNENIGAWQPLVSEVCTANDDLRMNSCGNPFAAIWNLQNGRGMAFHVIADSKWLIRVKHHHDEARPRHTEVVVELGMYDNNFSYELMPGEELALPTILFYSFRNRVDMDAYKLHRYCNDVYPARSMPIVYNSWMSRGDVISHEILTEQLEAAAELGAEYFVIDAGWFGAPGAWYDTVGDWVEATDCSMMGRMREFSDDVRAKGLKFGLWFELERAACGARFVKENPQHYIFEHNNYFIDFASEAACEYIYRIMEEQIKRYEIRYIKFDFNAPVKYDRNQHAFMEYFAGYRRVIDRLREAFPDLYLENCASGGMRMALANLRGFDSFWMSDNHSLYAQLEIFKNTILRMPCRALERWITIQSLERIKGRSREMILVSGDSGWGLAESVTPAFLKGSTVGGPLGISCDVTAFTPALRETLTEHIAQYKSEREFWKNGECRILVDTPTLLVLQFSDASLKELKIYAYVKNCHQSAVTVYPVCNANASYRDANGEEHCGRELEEKGIDIPFEPRFLYNCFTATLKQI